MQTRGEEAAAISACAESGGGKVGLSERVLNVEVERDVENANLTKATLRLIIQEHAKTTGAVQERLL